MGDPVSTLITVLDSSVARLSARAFEAAVRADNEPEPELSAEKKLLLSVWAGEASKMTPGIEEAAESGLVTVGANEELDLTPLGKYLLPASEAEEQVVPIEEESEDRGSKTAAVA
jgi:hypothetical protein